MGADRGEGDMGSDGGGLGSLRAGWAGRGGAAFRSSLVLKIECIDGIAGGGYQLVRIQLVHSGGGRRRRRRGEGGQGWQRNGGRWLSAGCPSDDLLSYLLLSLYPPLPHKLDQ